MKTTWILAFICFIFLSFFITTIQAQQTIECVIINRLNQPIIQMIFQKYSEENTVQPTTILIHEMIEPQERKMVSFPFSPGDCWMNIKAMDILQNEYYIFKFDLCTQYYIEITYKQLF